jgi:hypothetical protein
VILQPSTSTRSASGEDGSRAGAGGSSARGSAGSAPARAQDGAVSSGAGGGDGTAAGAAATAARGRLLDPVEEARLLAKRKQIELERMEQQVVLRLDVLGRQRGSPLSESTADGRDEEGGFGCVGFLGFWF